MPWIPGKYSSTRSCAVRFRTLVCGPAHWSRATAQRQQRAAPVAKTRYKQISRTNREKHRFRNSGTLLAIYLLDERILKTTLCDRKELAMKTLKELSLIASGCTAD
jgi:hypothetical protein